MTHILITRTTDKTRSRRPLTPFRRWLLMFVATLCIIAGGLQPVLAAQEAPPEEGAVYVIPVTGTIDLGLAPYMARVIDDAAANGAAAIILDIDTPGGRLDAVLQMRDAILGSDVRTVAFVDRNAFSAGALVAIAAEEIYMAPGAVMGAATPVVGGAGETADEKTISAVRGTFRSTAESRDRDPRVAEAMVDPDIEIDGLIESGSLLTLSTSEALAWDYTEGIVPNLTALLDEIGLADAEVIETSPSLAEDVVRFITDPVLASLLITIAMLMILGDFFSGGFGLVGGIGIGLLGVFFWGHMLAGLAGWEDVALVVLGVVLIAVELLVIPGFGVAGVLGLASLFGGLYLSMLGREITTPEGTQQAALSVAASFVATIAGFILILIFIPRSGRLGGLVLQAQLGTTGAPATKRAGGWLNLFGGREPLEPTRVPVGLLERAKEEESLREGAIGVALSDLRPGGVAEIDGRRIDVVTAGDYIAAGDPIELVKDERYRRIVRRATS